MSKPVTRGIDVTRLDQLVKDLGVRVRVWKSTTCPNMKSIESFDHDVNCPVCQNNMIDFDCFETMALFQQQELVEQFKVQGTFSIDEVMATFRVGIGLQTFARIDLLDFKENFYELVQRQDSPLTGPIIDKLKYPACDVDAVFVIRSGVAIRYHNGTDFKLDQNGSIEWLGTNRPADREIMSIYYRYHPVFRVTKAVHRDRFSQYNITKDFASAGIPQDAYKVVGDKTYVKLPETWILRRDYLLDRKDKITNQVLQPNDVYDPNAE